MKLKNIRAYRVLLAPILLWAWLLIVNISVWAQELNAEAGRSDTAAIDPDDPTYQEYLAFFRDVFEIMQQNYYKDIDQEDFDRFINTFNGKIYNQLVGTGKSSDFVRWRSAAFLVDFLKEEDDIFSAFYPPKPAKEYEETALGKRIDLGLEGEKLPMGYRLTFVEPRSNAYKNGMRENDLVVKIDDENVIDLDEKNIRERLRPLENAVVALEYMDGRTRQRRKTEVRSEEYFKQAVFNVPIPIEHIYCLKIERFNRKTFEDVFRFLTFYRKQGAIQGLIIDLRGNPGGPPLAAREISSFFLPPGDAFAYFQKKNQPKSALDVPALPDDLHYEGPLAILIDEGSGSASELFSGVMQRRRRAVLMGENSAGQVFLKSMFPLDDESMLLLVTARGHHPDGEVFSFDGLTPDRIVRDIEQDNILKHAASYIIYINQNGDKAL